jgi:DNA-binding transcriptional LysR family regulator
MNERRGHRRLPPLTALRTLEALHLTGSVTGAAQWLRVSHSAVSHQIKLLEEWSDTPLFLRHGRITTLSDAGQSLATIAHGAFDAIRHEIDRLPLRRYRPVSVAALPIIATQLVLPHMTAFLSTTPGLRVHLSLALTDRPTNPAPDLEIKFVRRAALMASDMALLPGDAVVACAPQVLARFGGDWALLLREAPLIHDEDLRMWPAWHEMTGQVRAEGAGDAQMILEGSGLIHAAVLGGLGVGFVRRALVGHDITAGRLCVRDDRVIDADWVYVLRADPRRVDDPDVARVIDWLRTICAALREQGKRVRDLT